MELDCDCYESCGFIPNSNRAWGNIGHKINVFDVIEKTQLFTITPRPMWSFKAVNVDAEGKVIVVFEECDALLENSFCSIFDASDGKLLQSLHCEDRLSWSQSSILIKQDKIIIINNERYLEITLEKLLPKQKVELERMNRQSNDPCNKLTLPSGVNDLDEYIKKKLVPKFICP